MRLVAAPFLWAKHGPIWFKEQSPEREAHLRSLLIPEVRRRDKNIAFVRMHARFSAPDCHELLNTLTYDRTYIIDLTGKTPEKLLPPCPRTAAVGLSEPNAWPRKPASSLRTKPAWTAPPSMRSTAS